MYKPLSFEQKFYMGLVASVIVGLMAAMSVQMAAFVVFTCVLSLMSVNFTAAACMFLEDHGRWGLAGTVPSVSLGLSATISASLLLQALFPWMSLGAPATIATLVCIAFGIAWGWSTRNEDWVQDSDGQSTLC